MIQFHNAKDINGHVVHINEVTKDNRAEHYYCLGCGGEMSPVLGDKREHHYHKYRLYTIRDIVSRWAPEADHNDTAAYIANVSKLTGIDPDEPIGIPLESPARWMMLGAAMAVQENGTTVFDYFAMLRGWDACERGKWKEE